MFLHEQMYTIIQSEVIYTDYSLRVPTIKSELAITCSFNLLLIFVKLCLKPSKHTPMLDEQKHV